MTEELTSVDYVMGTGLILVMGAYAYLTVKANEYMRDLNEEDQDSLETRLYKQLTD